MKREGWENTILRNVVVTKKGKKPKILSDKEFPGSVPYIDIEAFETGRIKQYADAESSNQCKKSDVLVVWDGARFGLVGKDQEGAIGSTLMCLTPVNIEPSYLYRFIKKNYSLIQEKPKGMATPHVDPDVFWNLELNIPPLPEQQRIVARLDAILPRVKEVRTRLEKVPEIMKKFRQSVLAAACEGRLTEQFRDDYYNDTGNELPEWDEKRIDQIFTVRTGVTPLRSRPEFYTKGTIPWIKTGEIKNKDIFQAEEFVTELAVKETNLKLFPVNTLLIAMYGEGKTRGSLGRLKIPATTNQACAALINEELDFITNQFIFYFLLSQYDAMRNIAVGGVRPNLNLDKIKSIVVPLPPLSEQREIVSHVERLFALADKIEARHAKALARVEKIEQTVLGREMGGIYNV